MTDRRKRLNFYLNHLLDMIEGWETDLMELAANEAITETDREDEAAVIEVLSNCVDDITLIIQDSTARIIEDAKQEMQYDN